LRNSQIIHELIITSPLGLVPRELELIYPASSYDIPVTGTWDEDEKIMIRSSLKSYLKENKYDKIICHLPNNILEFISDILGDFENTCIDKPTSKKSLEKLSSTLKGNIKDYEIVKPSIRKFEDFKSLALYQFGSKTGNRLVKNCEIRGKYPFLKLFEKNKQIGMMTKDRGLISLTINGAEKIKNTNEFWVEVFDDFDLIGSVFSPGVNDADKQIRIGDEVIVKSKEKLLAVGVAQINGEDMKTSNYGEAVKVRHRI